MTDAIDTSANAAGDALTFDIAEVLSGRTYPEVDVPFYLDEVSALTLGRAEKRLTELAMLGKEEEHDALEAKMKDLRDAIKNSQYTITLRGLSNKHRQDLLSEAFAKYPRPQSDTAFGIESDSEDRENHFSTLLLHAMTVKIQNPKGAVQVHPPMEVIEQIRQYAPQAAMEAILGGVRELSEGVKAGFEAATQDPDFLSEP